MSELEELKQRVEILELTNQMMTEALNATATAFEEMNKRIEFLEEFFNHEQ